MKSRKNEENLQDQIRSGIRKAFLGVAALNSDGVAKIGKTQVSLMSLEKMAKGLYSNDELNDLYNHPERDNESGTLVLDRIDTGGQGRATISRRVTAEGLRDKFGVSNSESLNFRQLALVNAVIFDVTQQIVGKLMVENPKDRTLNEKVEKATRAVLKNVDFREMGMENPGDNSINIKFIASFEGPAKKPKQSVSDPTSNATPPKLARQNSMELQAKSSRSGFFSRFKKAEQPTENPVLTAARDEVRALQKEIDALNRSINNPNISETTRNQSTEMRDLIVTKLREAEKQLLVVQLEESRKVSPSTPTLGKK